MATGCCGYPPRLAWARRSMRRPSRAGRSPERSYGDHRPPRRAPFPGVRRVLLRRNPFRHVRVLAIGTEAGVDLATLRRALMASPSTSNFLEKDVLYMLERGDYDEGFTLALACKDL